MTSLIFNTETYSMIQQVKVMLPQGLLLTGKEGVGLRSAALHIAGESVAAFIEPINVNDEVDHQKGIIRVKQIRSLYELTKSKSDSERLYIIDDADTMNHTAQNSLLKLLEEPVKNVSFVLTSHQPHKLLPTIRSRLQTIYVKPVNDEQTANLIAILGVTDKRKISQLIYLASGRPAELTRLITDEAYFNHQADLIADARMFLLGTNYQKYLVINKYYAERSNALRLISCVQTILSHGISQKPSRDLILTADKLTTAYDRIDRNGNVRIQLLACVL